MKSHQSRTCGRMKPNISIRPMAPKIVKQKWRGDEKKKKKEKEIKRKKDHMLCDNLRLLLSRRVITD